MQRKFVLVAVLAMAGNLLFCGVSLAGLCSDLGKDAGCVRSVDIKNQTVRAAEILPNAISGYKIKDGSIRARDLADGSVTAAKIKDGSIRARDLADGSVTAAKLAPTLEARIADLENKLQYVTIVEGEINGMAGPHVIITGANVHIWSGSGATDGTVNGLGNLIVGYNETRGGGLDDRTGSHNIVAGSENNYSSYGGLVVGYKNSIYGAYASVSGGRENGAIGDNSSVSGGRSNAALWYDASVSGGYGNKASNSYATVSGGYHNEASAFAASVSGGRRNLASGDFSFVGGGGGENAADGNEAFASYSAILGGAANIAGDIWTPDPFIGQHSTISGGRYANTQGFYSSASGGQYSKSYGDYSSVSGGNNCTASGEFSSISSGSGQSVSGPYDWKGGHEYFSDY